MYFSPQQTACCCVIVWSQFCWILSSVVCQLLCSCHCFVALLCVCDRLAALCPGRHREAGPLNDWHSRRAVTSEGAGPCRQREPGCVNKNKVQGCVYIKSQYRYRIHTERRGWECMYLGKVWNLNMLISKPGKNNGIKMILDKCGYSVVKVM